jgi:hypothetical protein
MLIVVVTAAVELMKKLPKEQAARAFRLHIISILSFTDFYGTSEQKKEEYYTFYI